MKKSNSTKKALGAFKKLGAVALITATLAMCFTACKQTGGTGGGGGKPTPPPTPKPKHAITFSVDSTTPNGTLKAKVEDIVETETSPINVEEDKAVTFIATANDGYKVKGWTLDGNPIAEAGTKTEYKHKVTAATTVKVSFESNSNPPTPQTKYTVTLNKTEGGKVTASPEIPADKKVLKDTVITFTAEAKDGYKIGKWTVTPETALQAGTGTDGSKTAKVKITADTSISVSFELIPKAILTLDPNKLTIKVMARTEDNSDIVVEGCKETTLARGITTTLTATGTRVVLKGKITEIYCYWNNLVALNVQGLTSLRELSCKNNQLTALNVQGCTALKVLSCYANKLNAEEMTAILNALPTRTAGDNAKAILYTEKTDAIEGNCKDYNTPEDLKKAFEGAKKRNWTLMKLDHRGKQEVL